MKISSKLINIALITILITSLGGCKKEQEETSHSTPVVTQQITIGQFNDTNIFTGTLKAKSESIISAETNGIILNLPIEEGTYITPETQLAAINTDSTNTQINSLARQIQALQYQSQTVQDLYNQQISNGQQNLNNTILVSNQSLQNLQNQITDTRNITLPDTRAINDSSFNIIKTQLEQAQSNLNNTNEDPTQETELQNQLAQLDSQLTQARAQGYSSEDQTLVQIKQLEDQLASAKLESKSQVDQQYQALVTLQKQKNSSIAEINTSLAQLQGQLESLSLNQSKGNLNSPITGVITEKYVELGQLVQAGTPIVKVADTSEFKINFDIPNDFLPQLQNTKSLSLQFDAIPNSHFVADITKINPTANSISKKVTVEATLRSNSDPRLLPGLYGTIYLNSNSQTGLSIPSEALISRYGQTYIFINENGVAQKRKVEIIQRNETEILVSGNIQPQTEIIIKGHQWLRNGDKVEVKNSTLTVNL